MFGKAHKITYIIRYTISNTCIHSVFYILYYLKRLKGLNAAISLSKCSKWIICVAG